MSFLNPYLLVGIGLIAAPILLHLLMRAKPRRHTFPALQLIASRRKTNSRRMRLKHIWLLILRCLVLAMLALALARPSLPPASYSLRSSEWLTLFGIILVGAAVDVGMRRKWQAERLPGHVKTYRQTCLRGLVTAAVLLLAALLVGWPWQRRIAAELSDPRPVQAENVPVAAVFIFDTSPSMEYTFENASRLDAAREIASKHLSRLPRESRLTVLDTADLSDAPLQSDFSAIQSRMDDLTVSPVKSSLARTVENAIRLLREDRERQPGTDPEQDGYLREVYLFTDLTAGSWSLSTDTRLSGLLEEAPWLNLYLIDVSVTAPNNVGMRSIKLSSDTVAATSTLQIDTVLGRVGETNPVQSIGLYLPDASGKPVKRDEQLVEFSGSESELAVGQFTISGLPIGINQGEIRLGTQDAMDADNRLFFTVDVKPPPRVLLTSDQPADVELLQNALAPAELVQLERAAYSCRYLPVSALRTARLRDYDLIVLMNVREPDAGLWKSLEDFVNAGGGLFVVMGKANLDIRSYLLPEARKILPIEPLGAIRFREPTTLDLDGSGSHPVFSLFEELGGYGELTSSEIRRCWSVDVDDAARIFARYSDQRRLPALIEQPLGDGRVIVLTSALDGNDWNDLVRSRWSFVVLADQLARYLARQSESRHNFTVGSRVVLRVEPADEPRSFRVRRPGLEQTRGELVAGTSSLPIPDADLPGQYRINSSADGDLQNGCSVNLPAVECDLLAVSADQLDEILGTDQYLVVRQLEELDRVVREARLGQEVFPLIVTLTVILFITELLFASRFYDAGSKGDAQQTTIPRSVETSPTS